MTVRIRPLDPRDIDPVVELSLRAWAPVFTSLAQVLGPTLDRLLTPDWRRSQRDAVRTVCNAADNDVWVAVGDQQVVGFVTTAVADAERDMGAIEMIAVDPDHQRQGIGLALTEHALAELRAQGMRVVMVETGGDPGHEPARGLYERAGFTNLPIARYFQALHPDP